MTNKTVLKNKLQMKEEEWLCKEKEYEKKLERVEKALSTKINQLLAHMRRDPSFVSNRFAKEGRVNDIRCYFVSE